MSDLRWVYMTVSDREEAMRIGRMLVESRLAACANVFDMGMTSLYRWDGAVQEDRESVLIVKTRAQNMEQLALRVRAIHSYDVPCILSLPISVDEGNPEFLAWLRQEATPAGEGTA